VGQGNLITALFFYLDSFAVEVVGAPLAAGTYAISGQTDALISTLALVVHTSPAGTRARKRRGRRKREIDSEGQ
jgi:hypothetical protein